MQKIDVAQVKQIVGHQFVIGAHRVHSCQGAIPRVTQKFEFRNACFIRPLRLAHPYPEDRVALHQRVAAHLRIGRDPAVTVGVFDTGAAAVETQPVVETLDDVAIAVSLRQRREPVLAAIRQRNSLAAGQPVHEHRFPKQHATHAFFGDIRGPASHVPRVPDECHDDPASY